MCDQMCILRCFNRNQIIIQNYVYEFEKLNSSSSYTFITFAHFSADVKSKLPSEHADVLGVQVRVFCSQK